jgi:hypothetical protein
MTKRARIGGIVTLLVLGGARAASAAPDTPAAEVSVARQRPWAVAGQMTFFVDGQPAYASIGVDVERVLSRYLRLDADVGRGLSSTVATTMGELHVESKVDLSARARGVLPLGWGDRHSLFLGVGPHYSTGGAYDDLWQARAEAGYAFRAAGGFTFLYAIGAELVMSERPAPIPAGSCVTGSCPGTLHAGDTTTVVRGAIGYSF